MNQPKSFDDNLSPDQRRRADILRRSFKAGKEDPIKRDPPAPGKIERFDDIFSHASDIARAIELRRHVKAEIYWSRAGQDEKMAIRKAVAEGEPYKNNELFTKHFLGKRFQDLIRVEQVREYIIKNVLGL